MFDHQCKAREMAKSRDDLKLAVKDWQNVLGSERVILDVEILEEHETTTFPTDQKIHAILRPLNTEDVSAIVVIASQYQVPVYPIGCGKNWGYGSKTPVVTGCVLIDMSSMNRIVAFDQELAWVTVEPGVTQIQLFEYIQLNAQGKLWMDPTGSSQFSSIVGNALERGHGLTPYGDHAETCTGFEIVLSTGQVIHTGFGAFEGAACAGIDRWGLGPALEGLFTQSNFGIVTKMTLWLLPAPEKTTVIQFGLESTQSLSQVADLLRNFRLSGTLKIGPHFGNSYFNYSRSHRYPWDLMEGQTPLSQKKMQEIEVKEGLAPWNGTIALYGSSGEVLDAMLTT